jgi:hypothetical protein
MIICLSNCVCEIEENPRSLYWAEADRDSRPWPAPIKDCGLEIQMVSFGFVSRCFYDLNGSVITGTN